MFLMRGLALDLSRHLVPGCDITSLLLILFFFSHPATIMRAKQIRRGWDFWANDSFSYVYLKEKFGTHEPARAHASRQPSKLFSKKFIVWFLIKLFLKSLGFWIKPFS